jgi:hypothetical protein
MNKEVHYFGTITSIKTWVRNRHFHHSSMLESPMRSARQGSKLFTLFFEFGIGSLNLGFIAQHFCNIYLFENEHLFLYNVWEPQSLYILSSEG